VADSALEAHKGEVERLTATWLSAYVQNVRTYRQRAFAKELNDPIWGTIRVSPAEVLILDSPLLQRLRHIKQLGVAHYVYPSAVHTRLEHSLGVMTLVEMLCASINAHSEGDPKPISSAYIELMRIAGLCHDVGHGLMSHVSENGLANIEACEDLRNEFSDSVGRRGRNQLSEIAAYYMLGSPAFLELLSLVNDLCPDELRPLDPQEDPGEKLPHWQRSLQRVIISEPINPSVPLLHELISGPFDADKLDYMSRDARFSGVPAITDIPRLIQKARSVECEYQTLPRSIQQLKAGEASRYFVTGIARSGARTLDELALGRALMFDKIYRHHKVRACEAMVSSILAELIKAREDTPAMLPYRIDDSQILNLDARTAAKLMGVKYNELTPDQRGSLKVVEDLVHRLRERRLLVRAFAFGPKMPGDAYRDDVSQKSGIAKIVRFAKDPARRLVLAQAIAEEALAISTLTKPRSTGEFLVPVS
jgi:HD superfamily phosphohydrolase